MWVGVLGPTVVRSTADGHDRATLKAAKHRALLATLALQPGRPVSADALVEALWADEAPPSALGTLHSYLSAVRRTLEPDLGPREPSRYLLSSDLGYTLAVGEDAVDAAVFARTVTAVHAEIADLTSAPAPVTDPARANAALARLDEALALWRGEAFADVPASQAAASEAAVAERARLGELRLLAEEDRATLLVAGGSPGAAVGELDALTARHPLRERLWTLRAVALARTGRQADALATLERLRTSLDDELGIDPSPAVRDLQTAILRQELDLAPVPAAAPAPPAPPAPVAPAVELVAPPWPLAGRGDQLALLDRMLDAADAGTPGFAVLVGEPGAGKSRLALELGLHARDRDTVVLLGRCSADEDAPPLWPWTMALGEHWVPRAVDPGEDHDAQRFALSEGIRADLLALARDRTVLLVLEDLHWADPSSLRVLRHLAAHAETGRLLVLCTWRRGAPDAPDAQPLAEASEALARRHATYVELDGLSAGDARSVLAAVAGDELDPAVSAAVHDRTEGNPFFLIEYARLARDEGLDLAGALESMPRTVSDVVRRRIRSLPERSGTALTAGAVIGREFDVELLAQALETSELEALDLLEPALAADLVRDLGADRFRFGHALVRDAAYGELSQSRRERMHAGVATLVSAGPGLASRAAEVARHWAAAGDRHVHRAWRAAAHAARQAMAAHATDEAVTHYESALRLRAKDPASTPRQHWDLLVGYADACRWSTRLDEMTEALDEAIVVGDRIGDPHLVVGAASVLADGAVWPTRNYGVVNEAVVEAMRRALDALPHEDTEVRCRLLLLLAGELFYGAHPAEIDALTEESIAMARRLGDRRLLLSTLSYGFSVRWRRATAPDREEMAREALVLAREEGDVRAELLARFLVAVVRCGRGDLAGVEDEVASIRGTARELRLYFLELATITLSQSWAAMRGDQAALSSRIGRLFELDGLISLSQKADALQGALLVPQMWGADPLPAESFLGFIDQANIPIAPGFTVMLLRQGQDELAGQVWSTWPLDLGSDTWFAELLWSFCAEIALGLGLPDLGAEIYTRLLPLRGQCVIAGTGPAHGPADAYLALAAAATGERALATEHAEVALKRCEEWDVPQVARWLGDLREKHGF
ncbi:MAG: AAA family ATPase [Nocardioidaceae bacterium]|nr:AAA family ATPase [Nocardioidaceae bacterium]